MNPSTIFPKKLFSENIGDAFFQKVLQDPLLKKIEDLCLKETMKSCDHGEIILQIFCRILPVNAISNVAASYGAMGRGWSQDSSFTA